MVYAPRMASLREYLGFQTRSETPPSQPPQGEGVKPPSRADLPLEPLSLSSVFRATDIITLGVMQLSLDVWRGSELLEKPSLVRRPDVKGSLTSFLAETAACLVLRGNAFWKVERNTRGEATGATVMDPDRCFRDSDGTIYVDGKKKPPADYQHLGFIRRPGYGMALGPIQSCRADLEAARDSRDYGNAWLQSGDVPSGVLKTDQPLTPDQATQWADKWGQREPHKVAVLGNGLSYAPTLLTPKDAQFIESQQFTTTGIARLFGIPAHLFLAVVAGGSQTYANIAQADLSFSRWTLTRYTREIEEAFTMLLPGQQTARFNLDALLRPDTITRYQAHKLALDAGWMLKAEVRAIEGLEPVRGIDKTPVAAPAATAVPQEGADA